MVDGTGNIVNLDTTGVAAQQVALAQAFDDVYERRRIAWIKMRFIPRYTSFIQTVGITHDQIIDAAVPTFANIPVYVVHDSNALNGTVGGLDANAITALLANTTGVKIKRLNRAFKVFRRSRKFPYAPKYMVANDTSATLVPGSQANIYPSGLWLSTHHQNISTSLEHTWVVSEATPSAYNTGLPLFTCVFEIKYQWADKRSAHQ